LLSSRAASKKEDMLSFYPAPLAEKAEVGETDFRRIVVRPMAHLYGKTPEPATTEARIY
jgi:hypothetical protein